MKNQSSLTPFLMAAKWLLGYINYWDGSSEQTELFRIRRANLDFTSPPFWFADLLARHGAYCALPFWQNQPQKDDNAQKFEKPDLSFLGTGRICNCDRHH
jgi:hypothetical protein